MTKPSYEERRITKHSGSTQSTDSANGGKRAKAAKETRPVRIQRRRSKGWKMPPNTVYVGRPTDWGNPFIPSDTSPAALEVCLEKYRSLIFRQHGHWHIEVKYMQSHRISELRGKNLACWCALGSPCHADVLLEIANEVAEN